MIQTTIDNARRYLSLCPRLGELLQYVKSHDMTRLPAGRIELDGERLFINIGESQLIAHEARKLEVHRRYIDVHFPLSSAEDFGWRHLSTLGESDAPFDETNDFALYTAPADKWFTLCPGEFCMVWPDDAHAPVVKPADAASSDIRKLVAKIRI